jgi:hypothetical protein
VTGEKGIHGPFPPMRAAASPLERRPKKLRQQNLWGASGSGSAQLGLREVQNC